MAIVLLPLTVALPMMGCSDENGNTVRAAMTIPAHMVESMNDGVVVLQSGSYILTEWPDICDWNKNGDVYCEFR